MKDVLETVAFGLFVLACLVICSVIFFLPDVKAKAVIPHEMTSYNVTDADYVYRYENDEAICLKFWDRVNGAIAVSCKWK